MAQDENNRGQAERQDGKDPGPRLRRLCNIGHANPPHSIQKSLTNVRIPWMAASRIFVQVVAAEEGFLIGAILAPNPQVEVATFSSPAAASRQMQSQNGRRVTWAKQ